MRRETKGEVFLEKEGEKQPIRRTSIAIDGRYE